MPQGSVLGPIVILICIDDLERNIKSNVNFFADDTMLFSIVKSPNHLQIMFNGTVVPKMNTA